MAEKLGQPLRSPTLRSKEEYRSKSIARIGMGMRLWAQEEASTSIHCLMEFTSEVAIACQATSLVKEIMPADLKKGWMVNMSEETLMIIPTRPRIFAWLLLICIDPRRMKYWQHYINSSRPSDGLRLRAALDALSPCFALSTSTQPLLELARLRGGRLANPPHGEAAGERWSGLCERR